MVTLNQNIERDYCILVSPSNQRPRAYLYAFNIQDMIPVFVSISYGMLRKQPSAIS